MHHHTDRIAHNTAFVTPVVEQISAAYNTFTSCKSLVDIYIVLDYKGKLKLNSILNFIIIIFTF